jgi:hypothetical protein
MRSASRQLARTEPRRYASPTHTSVMFFYSDANVLSTAFHLVESDRKSLTNGPRGFSRLRRKTAASVSGTTVHHVGRQVCGGEEDAVALY